MLGSVGVGVPCVAPSATPSCRAFLLDHAQPLRDQALAWGAMKGGGSVCVMCVVRCGICVAQTLTQETYFAEMYGQVCSGKDNGKYNGVR